MYGQFSFKDIEVFVKVISLGSFKEAARELNVTQSALTQRLKKLEDTLGARLIDRTTRTVAPTAVGLSFLPAAQRLLSQAERSLSDLQDFIAIRHGRVTVASLISIATNVLPQALARFSARHPGINIRVIDDSEQDITEHVRRGEAEFAIDMQTKDENSDPDLVFTPVMQDRFVLACRTDHALADQGAVRWDDFSDLPIIMLGPRSGTSRLLATHLKNAPNPQGSRYEVQHLSTMIGFIEAGLGVGIVPVTSMRSMDRNAVTFREITAPALTRTIAVVERRDATLSPAAAVLKSLLLEEIRLFEGGAAPVTPAG